MQRINCLRFFFCCCFFRERAIYYSVTIALDVSGFKFNIVLLKSFEFQINKELSQSSRTEIIKTSSSSASTFSFLFFFPS